MYGEYNYVQRESFIFDHLMRNQPILIPAADNRIQFCYTGDLAKIVTTLLRCPDQGIEIYNVGDQQGVSSVSYTHLDVYKRQDRYNQDSRRFCL